MMKQIELVPALELAGKLNVDVMDFPQKQEGAEEPAPRKRCGITLDYAPRDIRGLSEQGMDREAMLEYYRKRVYELVKLNIAQDWECRAGMEEVLAIVAKHLDTALNG